MLTDLVASSSWTMEDFMCACEIYEQVHSNEWQLTECNWKFIERWMASNIAQWNFGRSKINRLSTRCSVIDRVQFIGRKHLIYDWIELWKLFGWKLNTSCYAITLNDSRQRVVFGSINSFTFILTCKCEFNPWWHCQYFIFFLVKSVCESYLALGSFIDSDDKWISYAHAAFMAPNENTENITTHKAFNKCMSSITFAFQCCNQTKYERNVNVSAFPFRLEFGAHDLPTISSQQLDIVELTIESNCLIWLQNDDQLFHLCQTSPVLAVNALTIFSFFLALFRGSVLKFWHSFYMKRQHIEPTSTHPQVPTHLTYNVWFTSAWCARITIFRWFVPFHGFLWCLAMAVAAKATAWVFEIKWIFRFLLIFPTSLNLRCALIRFTIRMYHVSYKFLWFLRTR